MIFTTKNKNTGSHRYCGFSVTGIEKWLSVICTWRMPDTAWDTKKYPARGQAPCDAKENNRLGSGSFCWQERGATRVRVC